MKEILDLCRLIFTGTVNWFSWFLGGCDGPFCALLAFVALNGLTGFMRAVLNRTASGAAGFRYLGQKALIFGMVGIGHILDTQVIGTDSFLRAAIILFYIYSESVSLIGNAEHLGLSIPSKLKAVLEQFRTFQ